MNFKLLARLGVAGLVLAASGSSSEAAGFEVAVFTGPAIPTYKQSFTFSSGSNFFMEVAKFRAARLLWARAVGATGAPAEAGRLVFHARTSLWNKTVLDPHVNLLRTTTEAFAAVIGGCASLHVAPFDECQRVPDDFSRRLARNIQLILAEECQLGRVVDPAGGSWYVESLTRQLVAKAWALFQDVERRGGMASLGDPGKSGKVGIDQPRLVHGGHVSVFRWQRREAANGSPRIDGNGRAPCATDSWQPRLCLAGR